MFFKLNKKYNARIYFNQIQGSLLIKGRSIKPKTRKLKMFNNFLNSLSISINILPNNENNRVKITKIIFTEKLLLRISSKINLILRQKNNFSIDNNQNNDYFSFKQSYIDIKNIFKSKTAFIFMIIFSILILVFIYDYKSIEAKINQSNYYEIKKIESDYNINKCKINGDLPSLKQKCELMLAQIDILKIKKPSLISVFFIWLLDIVNSYFATFNLYNSIFTIIFLIVIYKLLK